MMLFHVWYMSGGIRADSSIVCCSRSQVGAPEKSITSGAGWAGTVGSVGAVGAVGSAAVNAVGLDEVDSGRGVGIGPGAGGTGVGEGVAGGTCVGEGVAGGASAFNLSPWGVDAVSATVVVTTAGGEGELADVGERFAQVRWQVVFTEGLATRGGLSTG